MSTIDAESDSPLACRTCRSSRCSPRGRKIRVVKSSCARQSCDDRPAEEAPRPGVHLAGDLLGRGHEHVGPRERQLQVALVVERHRVDLAERVLAVEHPAVGAREQRVGDVANALGRRGARPRRGTGALNPLPLEIGGDLAAVEPAGPRVAHRDAGPADRRVRRAETRCARAHAGGARAARCARASGAGGPHRTGPARRSCRARAGVSTSR